MKNILLTGFNLNFMRKIIKCFKYSKSYIVEFDLWKGCGEIDKHWSISCIGWADVVICEGRKAVALWYIKHKRAEQVLIIKGGNETAEFLNSLEVCKLKAIDCIVVSSLKEIDKLKRNVLYKGKIRLIDDIKDEKKQNAKSYMEYSCKENRWCKSWVNLINELICSKR